MVTFARVSLMPLPAVALVYGSEPVKWLCFFILTILGMTDFVDGMLARRDGPTKLGALMDPVADKVFVLAGFLAFAAIGVIPAWVLALILCREFMITALRSAVYLRGEEIQTSFWAKIKTDYQMAGLGFIFIMTYLSKFAAFWVLFACFFAFGSVALIYKFAFKKLVPYWIMPATWGALYASALQLFFGGKVAIVGTLLIILLATWGSAAEYLSKSYFLLKRSGLLPFDSIRLVWTVVLSTGVAPFVCFETLTLLPILFALSFEFANCGIDNVVAAEEKEQMNMPFILSICTSLCFSILAYGAVVNLWSLTLWPFAVLLAAASAINFLFVARKYGRLFKF